MRTRNNPQLSFDDKTFMGESYYDILVPKEHFLRKVNKLIDLSQINPRCASRYKHFGRPPEEPERMFRMLLVMFLYQIKHETELINQMQVNMAYKWFSGFKLTENLPDHSLFYVFRNRLGPKIFEEIFADIVRQCIESKLLSSERIFIDSTDMKDAAVDYTPYEQALVLAKAMIKKIEQAPCEDKTDNSYQPPKKLDEHSKKLIAEAAVEFTKAKRLNADKLLEKINSPEDNNQPNSEADKKPISKDNPQELSIKISKSSLKQLAKETFSEIPHARGDKDSRVGHTSYNESFTGYLATLSIGDEPEAFITGIDVQAGNSYAADNFKSTYQQHKQHTQQVPSEVTTDSAFDQPEVHSLLSEDESTGFIKARKSNTNSKVFHPDEFRLDKKDNLICPNNKNMQLITIGSGYHIYQGTACLDCPLASKCTTSKSGIRRVKINLTTRQRRQQLKILNTTEEFKQAQKRRLRIEGVIGHAKTFHLLGKSIYRSLKMQKIHGFLSAIAINIEKLVKALLKRLCSASRQLYHGYNKEQLVPT